jgi:hypothetical protein
MVLLAALGMQGTRQTAATIWRQEGIPGFYRGFSTVIFGEPMLPDDVVAGVVLSTFALMGTDSTSPPVVQVLSLHAR